MFGPKPAWSEFRQLLLDEPPPTGRRLDGEIGALIESGIDTDAILVIVRAVLRRHEYVLDKSDFVATHDTAKTAAAAPILQ